MVAPDTALAYTFASSRASSVREVQGNGPLSIWVFAEVVLIHHRFIGTW